MHRRHRVPDIGQAPGAELGGQLAEPDRQHCRILGRELPRHPDLGQVTVAYSTAALVFPAPPSPHKATSRGP